MSSTILKHIYDHSFTLYLQTSKVLGDYIQQQSLYVDNTMKAFVNLIENTQKYKKPLNPYVEEYLKQPVLAASKDVKKIALLDKDYEYYNHLVLISDSIDLFEWVHETNNMDQFMKKINKKCQHSKEALENALKTLPDGHWKWYKFWQDTFDEVTVLVASFYKNGLTWQGNEKYPSNEMFGDVATIFRMSDRQPLLNEGNRGENIVQVLNMQPAQQDLDKIKTSLKKKLSPADNTQVFQKVDKTWRIEHQKGEHKSLVVNTANKDDLVFIYNCENCTVVIGNELNTIRMDRCEKVTLLLRAKLCGIELVDCNKCTLHSFDEVNKMDLLSCKDVSMFLTERALYVKIYTEKCLGIEVNFPAGDNRFDKYKIGEKFVSTIVPHVGINTAVVAK